MTLSPEIRGVLVGCWDSLFHIFRPGILRVLAQSRSLELDNARFETC